jgi:hypothetical protein
MKRAAVTRVCGIAGERVLGFYNLAAGAMTHAEAPVRLRRNIPDPVPEMVLGPAAGDKIVRGRHIAARLLRRKLQAAEIAGGFAASPVDPLCCDSGQKFNQCRGIENRFIQVA